MTLRKYDKSEASPAETPFGMYDKNYSKIAFEKFTIQRDKFLEK
jgi:hypothetical protein